MSTRSVPEGVDLLRFVAEMEADADSWVQAAGFVEGVELGVPRGAEEITVALSGRAALVSLGGPRRGPLFAVVAVAGETASLSGGRLVRARSAGVTLTVSSTEDPAPDTSRDDAVVAAAAAAAVSLPPAKPSAKPPGKDWAGAAAASREREEREEEEDSDEAPAFGDRVDHFVFGLCEVMVLNGDRMKIRDLGASGKLREILLRAVRVQKHTMVDGKRVFKLVRKT